MTGPARRRPLFGLIAYGLAITERDRQGAPLPASLPVALAVHGVWGVVLMPKSPIWVFGPLAVLAAVRRRGRANAPLRRKVRSGRPWPFY